MPETKIIPTVTFINKSDPDIEIRTEYNDGSGMSCFLAEDVGSAGSSPVYYIEGEGVFVGGDGIDLIVNDAGELIIRDLINDPDRFYIDELSGELREVIS